MPAAKATPRAYALLSATAFFWGCNTIFAKLAVGQVSPLLLVSLRWLGAVLLLLIFANKLLARDWGRLRGDLATLLLMGALGFTTFNALFYMAAHATSGLNMGIIQGSIPVFVLIGAFVIHRTAASSLQIIGVALTIIGVGLVASAGNWQRLTSLTLNRGDYLMIIACLLAAGYALALRRFASVSSLSVFSVIAFSAFIASIPLSAVELLLGNLQWPTAKGWIIVALVTLFPSFLAQIFFIQGVAAIGPGRAGIFVNLVPIFASILAVSILGEPFKAYHGIALALVLGGIWLSERTNNTVAGIN
ncbi:DMT family transporter [Candidatus Spongiihabitans sp.]|uniref:DMT family transporter n=1 Tax=Candidatus Spongiihabitans sp. TaxID=3101308 RepID=UPI003C7C0145